MRYRHRYASIVVLVALLVAAAPSTGTAPTAAAFAVVQFEDPISDVARSRLRATGVEIIGYEPNDAYVVWGSAEERAAARDLAAVASVEPLPPSRKIAASLRGAGRDALPAAVEVLTHASVTLDDLEAVAPVQAAGRVGTDGRLAGARLGPLDPAGLDRLEDDPRILHVGPAPEGYGPQDEASAQIITRHVDGDADPVPGYRSWLEERGLDGSGSLVGVLDTGIDEHHPAIGIDRVEQPHDYTESNVKEPVDTFGHGTGVAGALGGRPPTAAPLRDPDGLAYGLGIAPGVRFLDLNAVSGFAFQEWLQERLHEIATDAWRAGARMWNGSWATDDARLGYTSRVRTVDEIARNADPATPGREEFLIIGAAGNTGSSGPPGPREAKNAIAVGATGTGRNASPWFPSVASIEPDEVAAYSAQGPTEDGRVFPTIVAPGHWLVAPRAPTGAFTICYPVPDAPVLYHNCTGTSFAAPVATGAAAIIHEWWERETGRLPSPAMVRALMINEADDIGEPNDIPNDSEGWGQLDLAGIVEQWPTLAADQEQVLRDRGDEVTYELEVERSGDPLRVTVAWSDAPALPGANPALVNDLDLVVERVDAAGAVLERWRGNAIEGGTSVRGGEPDRLNNVENVLLPDAEAGRYRLRVTAANLPGDGIPENADPTDQDFALVARTDDVARPEILDTIGDANLVNGQGRNRGVHHGRDTRPVSVDAADLRAVDFDTVGTSDDPALEMRIRTAAPAGPDPSGPSVRYRSEFLLDGCLVQLMAIVRGAAGLPDDPATGAYVDGTCTASGLVGGPDSAFSLSFDGPWMTATFPLSHVPGLQPGVEITEPVAYALVREQAGPTGSSTDLAVLDDTRAGHPFVIGWTR